MVWCNDISLRGVAWRAVALGCVGRCGVACHLLSLRCVVWRFVTLIGVEWLFWCVELHCVARHRLELSGLEWIEFSLHCGSLGCVALRGVSWLFVVFLGVSWSFVALLWHRNV